MIRLSGQILSDDRDFRAQIVATLRAAAIPVVVPDARAHGDPPDIVDSVQPQPTRGLRRFGDQAHPLIGADDPDADAGHLRQQADGNRCKRWHGGFASGPCGHTLPNREEL